MKDTMARFLLNDEQQEVKELTAKFSDEKVKAVAQQYDRDHTFPVELFKELGSLGLLGTCIPEEFGGSDLGVVAHACVMEQISRNSPTLGLIIDAHCSLGLMPLLIGGTQEQKEKYLIPGAQGEKIFAFGLTEPQSGSDAGGTKTIAKEDGDYFVLNGSKSWITNAGYADVFMICCKTDPDALGNKGISMILVERDTPGLTIGKPERKMSCNGSSTAQLFFDDCRVPKANLIGELNRGLPLFMQGLDEGRIAISAISVGMAEGVLDRATKYAKDRIAFGKPITAYQGVSFMLSEMETELAASRAMLYTVAKMKDAGLPFRKEAAMLKLTATEMVNRVCYKAIQVMGGNGLHEEYDVERFYRDARLMTIGEGTTEINKMLISRYVLEKY